MKETGIIMSGNHPKLILDSIKTQTRRVVVPHNSVVGEGTVDWSNFDWNSETSFDFGDSRYSTDSEYVPDELKGQLMGVQKAPAVFVDDSFGLHYLHVPYRWSEDATIYRIYPRYEVGDRLWVRETWATEWILNNHKPSELPRYSPYNPDELLPIAFTDTDWTGYLVGKTRPSIFLPRIHSRITLEITEVRVERLRSISPADALAEGGYSVDEFIEMYLRLNKLLVDADPWNWVVSFKKQ